MTTKYEIQGIIDGQWTAEAVGNDTAANCFATQDDAQNAISELVGYPGSPFMADRLRVAPVAE